MKKDSIVWVVLRLIGWLIVACLAAWLMKATVVSVSQVSSLSMSPALDPQEYILISRSSYRLRTPDAFPLSSFPFPKRSVDGWADVNRGDIVAFLSPQDFEQGVHPSRAATYAKRCVAVPGDTVRLVNRVLRVHPGNGDSTKVYEHVVSGRQRREDTWVVPGKRDTLRLGEVSNEQLERIIHRDGHRMSIVRDSLHVDGQLREFYVVEQDYYFFLGDNPSMSRDSRHWGLAPEEALIGEVIGVVWPLDT